MIPGVTQLIAIANTSSDAARRNIGQTRASLIADAGRNGLDQPHRLAHFLAQIGHESGRWRYDEEIWGPTRAQRGYEGRRDLGNTQPGDGHLYRGRTAMMVTGRYNYRKFKDWCRKDFPDCPDFETNPNAILLDPWEGLAPIWYWATHNLNRYADANEIETITRIINGGLNGYEDRLSLYTRSALVLLGRGPQDVVAFQKDAGLVPDGKAGPRTRDALHNALQEIEAPKGEFKSCRKTIARIFNRL